MSVQKINGELLRISMLSPQGMKKNEVKGLGGNGQ